MFKVHHIALSVKDIEKSFKFYNLFWFKKVLDWESENWDLKIYHLKLDNFYLELFCFKNYVETPKSSKELSTDLPQIWVKHFWLQVKNLEEIKQKFLEEKIAENIEIKQWRTWIKYFFIKDSDGILLEFVQDDRGL